MPPRRRKQPDESAVMSESDADFDSDDLPDDEDEYVPIPRAQRVKGQTPVAAQGTPSGAGGGFMKQCSKCKQMKDAEGNFWKDPTKSTGYTSWCKSCFNANAEKRKQEGHIEVHERQCSICKEVKSADQFMKDSRRVTGLDARCRECRRKQHAARKQRNIENGSKTWESKECKRCHVVKPAAEFKKHAYTASGLDSWCKQCCSERRRELLSERQAKAQPAHSTKECAACHEVKPATDFAKDKAQSTGLSRRCKGCEKEYRKNKNKRQCVTPPSGVSPCPSPPPGAAYPGSLSAPVSPMSGSSGYSTPGALGNVVFSHHSSGTSQVLPAVGVPVDMNAVVQTLQQYELNSPRVSTGSDAIFTTGTTAAGTGSGRVNHNINNPFAPALGDYLSKSAPSSSGGLAGSGLGVGPPLATPGPGMITAGVVALPGIKAEAGNPQPVGLTSGVIARTASPPAQQRTSAFTFAPPDVIDSFRPALMQHAGNAPSRPAAGWGVISTDAFTHPDDGKAVTRRSSDVVLTTSVIHGFQQGRINNNGLDNNGTQPTISGVLAMLNRGDSLSGRHSAPPSTGGAFAGFQIAPLNTGLAAPAAGSALPAGSFPAGDMWSLPSLTAVEQDAYRDETMRVASSTADVAWLHAPGNAISALQSTTPPQFGAAMRIDSLLGDRISPASHANQQAAIKMECDNGLYGNAMTGVHGNASSSHHGAMRDASGQTTAPTRSFSLTRDFLSYDSMMGQAAMREESLTAAWPSLAAPMVTADRADSLSIAAQATLSPLDSLPSLSALPLAGPTRTNPTSLTTNTNIAAAMTAPGSASAVVSSNHDHGSNMLASMAAGATRDSRPAAREVSLSTTTADISASRENSLFQYLLPGQGTASYQPSLDAARVGLGAPYIPGNALQGVAGMQYTAVGASGEALGPRMVVGAALQGPQGRGGALLQPSAAAHEAAPAGVSLEPAETLGAVDSITRTSSLDRMLRENADLIDAIPYHA